MIQRRVIINLVAFFGLTALLVGYGYFSLIHNPLKQPMKLYSYIDNTGGVGPGFTVDLRGVPVGHVGAVGLAVKPGSGGQEQVKISLLIDPGVSVPSDSQAEVERANPLGEQEVDIIPGSASAGPARSGEVLPPTNTPTPPDVGQVVTAADRLFSAVPTGDLATIIHQLALALNGRAQDLRTIIQESAILSKTTVAYSAQFRALLANAPPVLDTVAAVGPQLQDALNNTQTLVDLLNDRKDDLVNLFNDGTAFALTTDQVLAQNTANLACLSKDLGDVGANLSQSTNYTNLDNALLLNQSFFGPVNDITPEGPAKSLGPGSYAHTQTYLRVRTLLPPQMPSAEAYTAPHQIPDTYPGAACLSVFGAGVPAGSQADAAPPVENGKVIPAPAPTEPVEDLPPPTPSTGGTGPGNVNAGGTPSPVAVAPASAAEKPLGDPGHPEKSLFVGGGLIGLGTLERRELRKLRKAWRRRQNRSRSRRGSRTGGRTGGSPGSPGSPGSQTKRPR
jgi:phospholipid/cholesterol/gamma-HCH transport system substrate-binding protein